MALEQGEGLGKFLYKLAEAFAKKAETAGTGKAFTDAAGRLGRTPEQALNTGREKIANVQTKETFKNSSKEWVKKIASTKNTDKAAALTQLQKDLLIAADANDVRPVMQAAIVNARARGELPAWLPNNPDAIQNPKVAEFISRVALFSRDLQDDPYVVQREVTRLSLSTDWNVLKGPALEETKNVIRSALAHVRERIDTLNLTNKEKVQFSQATLETLPNARQGHEVRDLSVESARMFEDEAMSTLGETKEMRDAKAAQARGFMEGVTIPATSATDSGDIRNFFENMRTINGGDKLGPNELRFAKDEIRKALERTKSDGTTVWSAEEAARLRSFRDRISEYENVLSAKGERFNTIYVSQDETQEFLDNFYWFFEKRSREVERLIFRYGYDHDMLQHKMRRNELLAQWFSHEDFDDKLTSGKITGAEGITGIQFEATPEQKLQLLKMREAMFKIKTDVLDGFHNRSRIHEFFFALNSSADPGKDQRLTQAILGLNDRGVFGGLKHYGGLTDLMKSKIHGIHKDVLRPLNSTISRRSTAEAELLVRQRAARQLQQESPRHKGTYTRYLEKQINQLKGIVDDKKILHMMSQIPEMTTFDEGLCEAITNLGYAEYEIDMSGLGTMLQFGQEPILAEAFQEISSYRGSTFKDTLAQYWRPVSHHSHKYGIYSDPQRIALHGRARMYVYKDDRLFDACVEETERLWRVIEHKRGEWQNMPGNYFDDVKHHLLTHLADPFGGTEGNLPFRAKIQEYHELVKLRGIFTEYHNNIDLGGSEANFAKFLTTKIGKFKAPGVPLFKDERNTLFNYVQVHKGMELYERDALNPYGFWESGVFRGLIERAMKLHPDYGKYFAPGYANVTHLGDLIHGHACGKGSAENGFIVGSRILNVAGGHFNPKVEHFSGEAEHAAHALADVLRVGAKTHPHELLRVRNFVEGFQMSDADAQLFQKDEQLFGLIQHGLKPHVEIPINYSVDIAQWTDLQRQVFHDVFSVVGGEIGVTEEQFLTRMKGYFDVVSENINGYLDHKYAKMFSNILWTDDVPLAELESDEMLQAFSDEYGGILDKKLEDARGTKFSEQISHVGKARQSVFGITWMDHTVVFQNQLGTFINTLSPDQKTAMEAMIDSDKFFFMYNGKSDAAASLTANMSGFLEAAKNRFPRLLKNMSFSSYFRKSASSSLSPSFDVEDAHEFVEKIQAMRYAVHKEVPACAEAMEEIGGISNWRSIFTQRKRIQAYPRLIRDFLYNKSRSYTIRIFPFKGKTFDAIVERFNLYWPSGIRKYQTENAGLLLVGSAVAYGVMTAGGEEKEHQ